MSFTKLFGSITASTIWCEDNATRIVWVTMLAMADRNGYVAASVPGLAAFARVSIEECEAALAKFRAPDRYSRSKEHEGRRIEDVDGGWVLLNYAKYREARSADERREQVARAVRRHREKKRGSADKPVIRDDYSNQSKPRKAQAEAEAEAEAEREESARARAYEPPPLETREPELEPGEPFVPLEEREPLMAFVRSRFSRRFADRMTYPPNWTESNVRHLAALVRWIEEHQGGDPRAAAERILDGFFGDSWVQQNKYPLANLANRPERYLAGSGGSKAALHEQARKALADGRADEAMALYARAKGVV